MKKLLVVAAAMLFSTVAMAKNYMVDPDLSSVSFALIKKQYIVEPAIVPDVTGSFKKGMFTLTVDMPKVETNIGIRNERINKMYFTDLYPTITIKGKYDLKKLKYLSRAEIPATVTIYGNSKEMMLPVVVQKGRGYFSVNSTQPIIIKGSDFGIPTANLNALQTVMGGISISDNVPVNFNIIFKASK